MRFYELTFGIEKDRHGPRIYFGFSVDILHISRRSFNITENDALHNLLNNAKYTKSVNHWSFGSIWC